MLLYSLFSERLGSYPLLLLHTPFSRSQFERGQKCDAAARNNEKMRALLQRVLSAQVTVDGTCVGQIGPGLVVLLGIHRSDTAHEAAWLARKIASLRIFQDA